MQARPSVLAELLGPESVPPAPRPDPLELLGWMLELRGTVRMCSMLDERPLPPRPARAGQAPAGDPLWRMAHIQALALRPLREPHAGRQGLPEAADVREILLMVGQLGRRRRSRIDDAADEIATPFHEMVRARAAIARACVDELREALTGWLETLGPAAAYLVELDVALRESTEQRARQLFSRVGPALHQRFRDRLWEESQGLPDDISLEAIEAWYQKDGWIAEHIDLCRRVVEAVCRHETRTLEGLVAGAHELATETEIDG